jgi:chromate transporter
MPPPPFDSPGPVDSNPRRRLGEIAGYFTRLGFTAFGGPAAHIAMMEEELVHRRRWLDRQHFLDLVAIISFIPGPNSTELAIALGRLRGGKIGLLLAGACFILPAMLIILPIAWLYVNYHQLPGVTGALRGIAAAVVAIIASAVVRFAASSVTDVFSATIALLAAAAEWFVHRQRFAFGDLLILLIAAVVGFFRAGGIFPTSKLRSFLANPLPVMGAITFFSLSGPVVMVLIFLEIGVTLFGSGYVLVTYLQTSFVDHRHWLTQQQMLDAVAVGQITPGPLLTAATFVGFLLGHEKFGGGLGAEIGCAIAATAAIFAPAFLLITFLGTKIEKLRHHLPARGALNSMNAAVVGLIAATCLFLAGQTLQPPAAGISVLILMVSLGGLWLLRLNTTWIILAAGVAGWFLLSG